MDLEDLAVLERGDRRRARPAVEQAHLADHVPRTELGQHQLTLIGKPTFDLKPSGSDDEHGLARLALAHQHLAAADPPRDAALSELGKASLRDRPEQVDPLKRCYCP